MGFDTCDKFASRNFFSLTDDGDEETIVFLGEPQPKQGEFRGKPKVGFVFPVLVGGDLMAWEVGQRLLNYIRDNWDRINQMPVKVTRHGAKGDIGTTYTLKPGKSTAAVKKRIAEVDDEDINMLFLTTTGVDPETGEPVD